MFGQGGDAMSDDPIQELKLLKAAAKQKIELLRKLPPAKDEKEAKVMKAVKRDPGRGTRN